MPWKSYSGRTLTKLGNMPGTYAICSEGSVLYVGKSERVRNRVLKGHKIEWLDCNLTDTPWGAKPFVVVKVRWSRRIGEELMREARMIQRLEPIHNHSGLSYAARARRKHVLRSFGPKSRFWTPEMFERIDDPLDEEVV